MTAFDKCLTIHEKGKGMVSDYVRNNTGLEHVSNIFDKALLRVETNNRHGNLFIESWSNRNAGIQGWLYTTKFKCLFYLFLKQKQLVTIEMDTLRNIVSNNLFTEKLQTKYSQPNNTFGYCVPISYLVQHGGASTNI